jgi:hypothetical protein
MTDAHHRSKLIETVPRPWGVGYDGELRRDDVTKTVYKWDGTSSSWVPIDANEGPSTIYVNQNGNDANPGGDAANPVQTIGEAFSRVPPEVRHRITIDLDDQGGVITTYDEALEFKYKNLYENVDVIGKNRLAFIPSGNPNQVPANPLNTGDFFQITISGGVYNNGELVGMYALFTAGPHTGQVAFILANVQVAGGHQITFGYHPFPIIEGPYGPNDAFDIREITTIVEDTSGGNNFGTVDITGVNGSTIAPNGIPRRLEFSSVRLAGGGGGGTVALAISGNGYVQFEDSRVDGAWTTFDIAGSGKIVFQDSMHYLSRYNPNQGTRSTPSWRGTVQYSTSGVLGGLVNCNGWGRTQMLLSLCNIIPDVGITPTNGLFRFDGGTLQIQLCGIDCIDRQAASGAKRCIPIDLERGGSGSGSLIISSSEILNSNSSGIETRPTHLPQHNISIDEFPFFVLTTIDGNNNYGIDLSSPCTLVIHNAVSSPIGNGIGGIKIRRKAIVQAPDLAALPTFSNAAGTQDIDFDDRAPILWLPWTVATAFGPNSHAAYIKGL